MFRKFSDSKFYMSNFLCFLLSSERYPETQSRTQIQSNVLLHLPVSASFFKTPFTHNFSLLLITNPVL